jgi:hypothetical protein
MLLRRILHPASSAALEDAYALPSASRAAYQRALSERLPLAHIAEQSERPQYWFANSILQVVNVFGRAPDETDHVSLTRETISGLRLTDDMASLVAPGEEQPRFVDFRVTKEEFERYLAWARTVY